MLKIKIHGDGEPTIENEHGEDVVGLLKSHGIHIHKFSILMEARCTSIRVQFIVENVEIEVPENKLQWFQHE